MDVSQIIAQWGAYYKEGSANESDLYKLVYGHTDTTKHMTRVLPKGNTWKASRVTMSRVLQPFHKNVTPLNPLAFLPIEYKLYHHKIDLFETPDDLEESYVGFLAGEGVNRSEWPFAKWFAKHVLDQFNRDYELNELGKGVYAAPNGTTPGAAGTSMNGFLKLISDGIAATRMTAINTGVLSTTPNTFAQQIETFVAGANALNEDYANIPMKLFMSNANYRRFRKGNRALYGLQNDFEGVVDTVMDTNTTVVPSSALGTSNRIFMTTKDNFKDLIWREARAGSIKLQEKDRGIQMLGDTYRGVGFVSEGIVFPNDQA